MPRKKRSRTLAPSKTQERLKKELYARKSKSRRARTFKPWPIFRWIGNFFQWLWGLFPKFILKPRTTRELWGIFLFFLSFLIVLAIYSSAGSFGVWLHQVLKRLIGWGEYILPFVASLAAIKLLFFTHTAEDEDPHSRKGRKDVTQSVMRMYFGIFFFTACILGMIHLQVPFEDIREVADQGEYGGYFGFTVNFFLRNLLGSTGTFFACFFGAIASLLFGFDLSLRDFWKLIQKFLTPTQEERSQRDDPSPMLRKKKIVDTPKQSESQSQKSPSEKQTPLTIQNFTLGKGEEWEFPNLNLLDFSPFSIEKDDHAIYQYQSIIKRTLEDFNIVVEMGDVSVGPTVTQFAFKPEAGTKLSKIVALQNDLALALAAESIRMEAPIPGKSLVGIEIPNKQRNPVKLRDILESQEFNSISSNLRLPLGRDVAGKPIVADLASMPHLLVAGSTGSGKSVGINTFLISLLYQNSPVDLRLLLVDPKRVEMAPYNAIPHLLTPVITDPVKTVSALRWAVAEMDRRYTLFAEKGHRNITEFNKSESKEERIPFIVIVIDELADLMMVASKEVETLICRLAQMARAVGIHLIVATQRPSVDVITGLIKANIPARIAFTVSSGTDSRTILDSIGAEKLLGRGDMLYLPGNESRLYRVQGVFLEKQEISQVLRHVKLAKEPDYQREIIEPHAAVTSDQTPSHADFKVPGLDSFDENDSDEEMFLQSLQVVRETKKASASLLQRRLRIGYSRAARMIDMLEERGHIGPAQGSRAREVYE